MEAAEDEAGADDDEEDGFIAAKVIVLEFCNPVFMSGVPFSIFLEINARVLKWKCFR